MTLFDNNVRRRSLGDTSLILCSTILEESMRNAFYHRSQVFITAREAFITVPGKNITGSMNSDAQIPLIYPGDPSQVQ